MTKTRVAILFGGRSSEHAISCATAAGVLGAIDRDAFDVVPIGISPRGEWVLAADDPDRWKLSAAQRPAVGSEQGAVMFPLGDAPGSLTFHEPGQVPAELAGVDVVLPLLHGPFGEDGTVQGLLELAGVPYVGSGVFASAAGMDKQYMNALLREAGLPIGPFITVSARQWRTDPQAVREQAAGLNWPVFVKPARAGSSVGVTKVDDPGDLDAAIVAAQEHDPKVLIEEGINGREIECAVLEGRGDNPPRTTLAGEIVVGNTDHGFYDFDAKYIDTDGLQIAWPADIPDAAQAQVRDLAAKAFDALGCEGLARADFFYTEDGTVLVNELNTMPGFTPSSVFPMLWQKSGLGYTELITELIELALERPTGLR